jgi:hypothetical protein
MASVIQRFVALSPLLLSCGGAVSTSTSPPPPDTSNTFASSEALVIDATSLYWIDFSAKAVMKAPRAGGSAQTLTTGANGEGIAVNATDVFWIDSDQIKRVSIGGGPSAMVAASNGGQYGSIAVDREHVYFSPAGTQELAEMTLATGVTSTLAETSVLGLALDGDQIFGTSCEGGGVWRVPKAGAPRVTLVHDALCPLTIATRGNYVYYVDQPRSPPNVHGALFRVPRDGGTSEQLAPIDGKQFAVDATSAYAFQSGALVRIPLDKSPTTKLADVAGGLGIAVDDARVYWITNNNGPGPIVLGSATK